MTARKSDFELTNGNHIQPSLENYRVYMKLLEKKSFYGVARLLSWENNCGTGAVAKQNANCWYDILLNMYNVRTSNFYRNTYHNHIIFS